MKTMRNLILWPLLFVSLSAEAGSTTIKQLDTIKNSTGGASLSVPSAGTTFDTDTNTLTLQNKTISGSSNTITNVSLTAGVTGTLPFGNGGTGQTSYTDGQLLIGNTSTGGLTKATITAGTNITVTNGNGSITIAATGGGTWGQEVVAGGCNGSATSFTLANTPTSSGVVSLYLDQEILRQGSGLDYTISSATITLASACATGQTLYAVYTH